MAALKIFVLACVSREQFPNKRRFQSHLEIYNRCFNSAEEGMSFISVHGRVENVMRSPLNIKTTVANRIKCVLKTMFEFVFTQMTKTNTQS